MNGGQTSYPPSVQPAVRSDCNYLVTAYTDWRGQMNSMSGSQNTLLRGWNRGRSPGLKQFLISSAVSQSRPKMQEEQSISCK
jgi:hypothetical protein